MEKKLYRSNDNKIIAGVCGGIGKYFGIDPTVIRVGWAILACCGGAGVIAYVLAAVIMPAEPAGYIDAE